MKAVPLLALAALGCASAPAPPPNGPALLLSAIDVTRAAQSLHYEFTCTVTGGGIEPLGVRGEAVWTQGAIVFMRVQDPEALRQLVVVGDRAWMYHEPTGTWPDPAKLGRPDFGRGPLNLADLLDRLEHRVGRAVRAGRREGADLIDVTLPPDAPLDEIHVRLEVDGGLIRAVRMRGTLAVEGLSLAYDARLAVQHVNEWYFLPFTEPGPDGGFDVDVFHSAEVLAALAAREGLPRALAIRVAVWREELIAQLAQELADERTRAIAEADFITLGDAAVPALEKMRGAAARRLLERMRKP